MVGAPTKKRSNRSRPAKAGAPRQDVVQFYSDRLREADNLPNGENRTQLDSILAEIEEKSVKKSALARIANQYISARKPLSFRDKEAATGMIREIFTQRARRAKEFEMGLKQTPS